MKLAASLLFILLSNAALSQTKEILYDYAWKPTDNPGRAAYLSITEKRDSLWVQTDYYIHKRTLQMSGSYKDSAMKIRHGIFSYYHANGILKSKGEFVNDKRQGLWVSYHDNSMMSDSTVYENGSVVGTRLGWHKNGYLSDSAYYNRDGSGMRVDWFDNGNPSAAGVFSEGYKRHGKWKFYHKSGIPASIEVYEKGKLLSKQYFDEKESELSDTTSRDREATYKSGQNGWKNYLMQRMYFPSHWEITGSDNLVVVVNFTINEDGKIEDAFVAAPVHPQLDKLAIDIIMKSPKWEPAISHNRRVKNFRSQPITFIQSD